MSSADASTELWTSNGTSSGTTKIVPTSLQNGTSFSEISDLQTLNSQLVFIANDGDGDQLWESNGTASGTTLVDPNGLTTYGNGSYGSTQINNSFVNNGILYFVGNDGTDGLQVYQTDGTVAGTQMVTDINAGNSGYNGANPLLLAYDGNQLFFFADDGIHGEQLWSAAPSNGPTITPITPQTVTVEQPFGLTVQATDSSDPTPNLVYSLIDNPPSTASINPSTGAFTWTPPVTGVFAIVVQVEDTNQSTSSTATFQVTVNPAAAAQLLIESAPSTSPPARPVRSRWAWKTSTATAAPSRATTRRSSCNRRAQPAPSTRRPRAQRRSRAPSFSPATRLRQSITPTRLPARRL